MGAMGCAGQDVCGTRSKRHGEGFSLVELLVVVAIASAVTALAVPSMAGMVSSQRVGAYASAFQVSLHLARSDAVTRGATTVVCKSTDGDQCASTGGWEQGWIVFRDGNHNALREPGEPVVARQDAAAQGVVMRASAPVARYVAYTASGIPRQTTGAFQAGSFTVCGASPAAAAVARRIVLAATGRARIQSGSQTDCQ